MTKPDDCVLAIDLGTSGCKAALVTFEGQLLAWESKAVKTHLLPGGGAEQDPEDWHDAIAECSRRLIERELVAPGAIKAVCANAQGEGTVPVDENGNALCNAILWMDTRGQQHVRDAVGGAIQVSGYAPANLVRYLRLTGGAPSLTGKDNAGHMLFIKHERPDIYARTHKFLNVIDTINLRICGEMAAPPDSIMTAWVTDNRNSAALVYDDGLCRTLGIPKEKFPPIRLSTDIIGEVLQSFSKVTGVPAGTPVVAGSIDTSAAAVGSGAVNDGDLHLYLGTSSWMGAHVPYKKTDITAAIASVPCAIPGKYLLTALQATAGGNINYLRDQILFGTDAIGQDPAPSDIYDRLEKTIEQTNAGCRGLVYTPWIYGERAPIEDHNIRAGFHNISLDHSRAEMIRAVYEGVAFNTRWLLKPVEKFLGNSVPWIAAVGGGAISDAWCRIFADVMNRPIRQIENPIESNVRGSAFIAAVALGRFAFDDVAELVPVKQTYEPNAKNQRVYDVHFEAFVNLYKANHKIHKRLNEFHRAE